MSVLGNSAVGYGNHNNDVAMPLIHIRRAKMAGKKPSIKAPSFSLPNVSIFSGGDAYKRGPVILVFYDKQGSDF